MLSFDLLVREGETTIESWPDLRFGDGANGWRAMLQPSDRYGQRQSRCVYSRPLHALLAAPGRAAAASASGRDAPILPLGMGVLTVFQGPRADPLRGSKDGLDAYDPVGLFVDEAFAAVGVRSLLATANDLLHLADPPRRLRAMHSLIPVDEVAMIAIPDLAHIGWAQFEQPQFTEPAPTADAGAAQGLSRLPDRPAAGRA